MPVRQKPDQLLHEILVIHMLSSSFGIDLFSKTDKIQLVHNYVLSIFIYLINP